MANERPWVVQNGDWYLCEGPAWSVSTWTNDVRHATRYRTRVMAREVVRDAIANGHRPFGCKPETAKAVRHG